MIQQDFGGSPIQTETGIRCGYCKGRHANRETVRYCHESGRAQEELAEADYRAELAVERWYEDRGYWDARAQEDYEARMGVIPFDVAMAEALGQL